MTPVCVSSAKRLSVAVGAIAAGMVLLAAAPQPQDLPQATTEDGVRAAATALNAQRADFFQRKDVRGVASEYTPDATYVELMPRLEVLQGRDQIQHHFQELLDAHSTDLTPTVTMAEMLGRDTALVGGDYSLVTGNKKISGHFFQVLRRDGPTWKIALQSFARPEPVTVGEADNFRGG